MPLLEYTITQEIIDEGCRLGLHSATNCPNYRAAIDAIKALGWADAAFHTSRLCLFTDPDEWAVDAVHYPKDVYDWINAYDLSSMYQGVEVPGPATFAFEIPAPPEGPKVTQ
jgi:hypothetical protein